MFGKKEERLTLKGLGKIGEEYSQLKVRVKELEEQLEYAKLENIECSSNLEAKKLELNDVLITNKQLKQDNEHLVKYINSIEKLINIEFVKSDNKLILSDAIRITLKIAPITVSFDPNIIIKYDINKLKGEFEIRKYEIIKQLTNIANKTFDDAIKLMLNPSVKFENNKTINLDGTDIKFNRDSDFLHINASSNIKDGIS